MEETKSIHKRVSIPDRDSSEFQAVQTLGQAIVSLVSIPDRDSSEFQGDGLLVGQMVEEVSIPDRDSSEFQAGYKFYLWRCQRLICFNP